MISNASLAAFSAGLGTSPAGGAPALQRPRLAEAATTVTRAPPAAPGMPAAPDPSLPRGSLLDLSV